MLHGSRARGEAHEGSDWDFAFLGPGVDVLSLGSALARILGTDAVDIADLAHANGLLRYRVARDAEVLLESAPELWDRFWFEAVSYWLDMEPIVRAGREAFIESLQP